MQTSLETLGELERRLTMSVPVAQIEREIAQRLARLATGDPASAGVGSDDIVPACAEGACPDDPLSAFDADEGPPVWTDETKQVLGAEPAFGKHSSSCTWT